MKWVYLVLLLCPLIFLTGSMKYEPDELILAAACDHPTQEHIKLKEYVDIRISAVERQIDLARAAMDNRLEGMNNLKRQLDEQVKHFVARDSFDVKNAQQDKDIRELREARAKLEGMASQTSMYLTLTVSVAALAMTVVGLFLRSRKV